MLCVVTDESTRMVLLLLLLLLLFTTKIRYVRKIPLCAVGIGGSHDNCTDVDDSIVIVTFCGGASGSVGVARGGVRYTKYLSKVYTRTHEIHWL